MSAGLWVARAEALPDVVGRRRAIGRLGRRRTTWRQLAARGIWVHGCAEGLGDARRPAVDALAGTGRQLAPR